MDKYILKPGTLVLDLIVWMNFWQARNSDQACNGVSVNEIRRWGTAPGLTPIRVAELPCRPQA